jgi:RNA polymerase sigma-70 factor (ECF subfamily)
MNSQSRESLSVSAGLDPTPSRLLIRLRTKDVDAFQRLADLYGPLVWHWCRHFGLQAQDAADVMQETFVSVWSAIGRFEHQPGQGRFRKWLWTITRNKINDHFRRHATEPEPEGGTGAQLRMAAIPDAPPEETSQHPAQRAELKSLYGRALELVRAGFEDHTWRAFWMATVERRSTAEVAAALGMSPQAVRQAKCRVLRRLREELGDFV